MIAVVVMLCDNGPEGLGAGLKEWNVLAVEQAKADETGNISNGLGNWKGGLS